MTTFRLIIVNNSPQEAKRLSSMFQNAGKPCRAQHITSEDSLNKIVEEQDWDLVIAYDNCKSLSPATVIRNMRKLEKNTATILLTDDISSQSIIDGMKLGACDVAQLDDDQHLLLIVNRELENHRQRKLTNVIQNRLKEVERRNQKLLDSSRDGIAFVQDGMYLYANDSFAEMLGYESRGEVELTPIMDTIDESNHQHVKKVLKDFSLQKDVSEHNELKFTAVLSDGSKKKMATELFIGEHEGEQCIQLICYAKLETQEIIEAELQNIKFNDATTGLYNRAFLIEEIEQSVLSVEKNKQPKSFIYIDIDRFSKKVKSVIGITESDQLLKRVANFIKEHYTENDIVARISDHAFGIISHSNDPGALLDQGNQLCKKVSDHLFEIDKKTLQVTLSIGICLINENTIDYHSVINHAIQAADALRKSQDGNGSNIYQRDAQESKILASSLKTALENDDFRLLFQPILSLRGEDTERYEVLLRMIVDDQSISPTQFFIIAESLKLSKKVDRWVIVESIRHLKASQKQKTKIQQFINITNASLCDESLLPWLEVAINTAKIDPSCIIFQAKEVDIIQHLTTVKKFVGQAKAIGIDFCITNYGSLHMEDQIDILDHIDVGYVKIDGALSQELQTNPEDSETLERLVSELHERDKITTIPLIEKASVLSKLWQLGVHCIQGNYLQPPNIAMDYEFITEN
ncbi:hypothetical protein AB835_04505 [Candidatus Endobugula sertula]|uniref:Ferrous iron transporter C n=1 Tax=Candidatus Endobugula sertula TaxID=62101 RepID=A0A1D2QRU6_9GAMM|nr:hypothetical protein AB835_04505 [Candidatus Endobugula sertula]